MPESILRKLEEALIKVKQTAPDTWTYQGIVIRKTAAGYYWTKSNPKFRFKFLEAMIRMLATGMVDKCDLVGNYYEDDK